MKLETYTLESDADKTIFEFVSEGPKGNIYKLIFFQRTEIFQFYNLAFCDKTVGKDINDLAVSNNGDTEKILATIIKALYAFFDTTPKSLFTQQEVHQPARGYIESGSVSFMKKRFRTFIYWDN